MSKPLNELTNVQLEQLEKRLNQIARIERLRDALPTRVYEEAVAKIAPEKPEPKPPTIRKAAEPKKVK